MHELELSIIRLDRRGQPAGADRHRHPAARIAVFLGDHFPQTLGDRPRAA